MGEVQAGSSVTISYIGTLDDGTIFYSTEDHEPLKVTIGADQIFSALERALLGMRAGETKNVVLCAEDAYGPRRQENIIKVSRGSLPADRELTQGQKLTVEFAGGKSRVMRVLEFDEAEMTLDGNHALAGCELSFALRVDRVE